MFHIYKFLVPKFAKRLSSFVQISPEVKTCLSIRKPLVALESTIITHGMPFPDNLNTALKVEEIIRENGATPASIGVLGGVIKVGLTNEELSLLASKSATKVSLKDLPVVVAKKLNGGTTVAATMAIAHAVGIPVFVTGGIGGVHRGGEVTLDISADLMELGRTPVAVVCSGVKSILDIGRTLEVLETQGVIVTTLGPTDDFPAFYSRCSGFKSPWRLDNIEDAVTLLQTCLSMQWKSGLIVTVPVPEQYAIPAEDIESAIKSAVDVCQAKGVRGPSVTPFILKKVAEVTAGRALNANKALIENNATVGAKIAAGLCQRHVRRSSHNSPSHEAKVTVVGGSALDFVVCVDDKDFKPKAVFFTCMDSRMIPTRFTETNVGDMFVVRNAGNLIPHSRNYPDEITTTEPAALELGCIINNIRHVIVCGHSDCKAMNLLHSLQNEETSNLTNRRISPLKAWMCAHASSSLVKYKRLLTDGLSAPVIFEAETPQRQFVAYIDPDNKFATEDKLSQINTLQQLQNIASHGFLKRRLERHELHIHALWFDIYTGDIYYFSRAAKRFVEINESSIIKLLQEVNRYYS